MKKTIFVISYLILTVLGLVLMKIGGNTGTFLFGQGSFSFSMSLISLLGFISYILSFLLFTNLIVKFDLSYIMPISSGITQVLTLLSGYLIFKEKITINGIIGVSLVIIGIIIINIKPKKSIEDIK